jgi:hypothetical protein
MQKGSHDHNQNLSTHPIFVFDMNCLITSLLQHDQRKRRVDGGRGLILFYFILNFFQMHAWQPNE